jgi:nitrogenase molybdenum-iron protein NifN
LFFERLTALSGKPTPGRYTRQRARLIDAYVDGHKYVFGKNALLYGPSDWVAATAVFLHEIGMTPAVCGISEKNGGFKDVLRDALGAAFDQVAVIEDTDFVRLETLAKDKKIDMVIGNSNGCKLARRLNAPLVRVGLPIHDRIGAARIAALGYAGTQQLYDRIVNAFLRLKQESSPVGYTHL